MINSVRMIQCFLLLALYIMLGCSQQEPLFHAARQGNLEKVANLLNQSDSINKYIDGENLICIAIDTDNLELLRLLILRGADLTCECSTEQWDSPILRAVKQNRVDIVRELLNHRTSLDHSDNLNLELPDKPGLSVFDYIRTPMMQNVFQEKDLQQGTSFVFLQINEENQKYFNVIMDFLFGVDQEYENLLNNFDDIEIEVLFRENYLDILRYIFHNTNNFYINEHNLNILINKNKELSKILLSHVYSIFCIRTGLVLDPSLPIDKKKVLDFIYYNSMKIGNKIIVKYGNSLGIEQINEILTSNLRNDWLNIDNQLIVGKIKIIEKQYSSDIFYNLIEGKDVDELFQMLKTELNNSLISTPSSTTNMIRETSHIIVLGKSTLSKDL